MPLPPTELTRLVDAHWGTLCAWLGASSIQTDDIVQTAFIKLAAEHPPPKDPLAWLFTVTRRLAINEHVADQRRSQRAIIATELRHKRRTNQADPATKLDIQQQLASLEDHQREILVARIWGDLSFEQIAEATGSSKSTVWRIYRQGIEILKQQMSE